MQPLAEDSNSKSSFQNNTDQKASVRNKAVIPEKIVKNL